MVCVCVCNIEALQAVLGKPHVIFFSTIYIMLARPSMRIE